MTGRPSIFTDELAATICERVAGGETVSEICRDEAMPARSTVYLWMVDNQAFSDALARAREAQAESFADELHEIADDGTNDWMDRRRQDGSIERVVDHEHISRSKLRIETRRWLMSKFAPKRYGDKTEITGAGGKDLIPATDASDVARRVAFMLATGAAAQAPTKD